MWNLSLYSFFEAYHQRHIRQFLSGSDVNRVDKAIRKLLSTLKTWEPNGELVLDISVYSPSDSKAHFLNYLTFEPDTHSKQGQSPGTADPGDRAADDHWVFWNERGNAKGPIMKTFSAINIGDPASEIGIPIPWKNLPRKMPSVPAMTGVLLRQQTRQQWRPATLKGSLRAFRGYRKSLRTVEKIRYGSG